MEQYSLFELRFQGDAPSGSEVSVDLQATFTWCDESGNTVEKDVKGFYTGGGAYIVRFLPETPGEYSWKVRGCIDAAGGAVCKAAEPGKHGVIRAVGTRFVHADGTAFLPVGTTIYALAHQEQGLIDRTLETLKNAPFNKVRLCVFPKHFYYNHNEPELFAFEMDTSGNWDANRPCFAFWNHLESILFSLADRGIQSDLILFHPYDRWGFSSLTADQNRLYLDYLLRRLSAIPEIWWSMANEFDAISGKSMNDWYEIETFIAGNDPFHHLLSNHNCFSFYDFTRPAITHCSVQTTQVESAAKWLRQYQKPLIYDECCYEGDLPMSWGNISAFEMVNRFWIACVSGAYVTHGEVFLADDEILWWSKGGDLKGDSPKRISFLKKILEAFPASLEPWEVNNFQDLDPEFVEMMTSFSTLASKMPESQQESHLVKDTEFRGHCGESVYIQYLARHCNSVLTWRLPEDKKYQIDLIDVWEMTRETVLRNVKGKIHIHLPGKEGIAVVATLE